MGPILCLLPAIASVYTNAPIVLLACGLDLFPFSQPAVAEAMLLQSLMVVHLWLLFGLGISARASASAQQMLTDWLQSNTASRTGIQVFLALGGIIATAYLANFYISGAHRLIGVLDRAELASQVGSGKTWLLHLAFSAWMLAAVLIWNSPRARSKISAGHCCAAAVFITMFAYPYLRVGSRRQFATLLLMIIVVLFLRARLKIVFMVVLVAVPLLVYLGASRSVMSQEVIASDPVTFYLNSVGEFIFPHFPLIDHVASGRDLWMGWSYLRFPAYALPSFGAWPKAQSLSSLFSESYANGQMGYAYTPMGEGFANFGYGAVLLVPLIVFALLRLLFWLRLPLATVLFFALSMNLNRGESATVALELLMFTFAIALFLRVLKIRMSLKAPMPKLTPVEVRHG